LLCAGRPSRHARHRRLGLPRRAPGQDRPQPSTGPRSRVAARRRIRPAPRRAAESAALNLNRQSSICDRQFVPNPILEFSGISKTYGGLRPLRLRALSITPGIVVALAGFDQTTAEVFVNLATGA